MISEGVIGGIGVTVGTLFTAWITRRNAKEQTSVTGFAALTERLQKTLDDTDARTQKQLADEAARTTKAIARIDHLERIERRRRELARRHEDWDRKVLVQLRQLTTDPIPDPPPLDTWEDDR